MAFLKASISLILIAIMLCLFVSAGEDAPPALPSEFWGILTQNGNPVPDALTVTAEVDGMDYAQPASTLNGKYDVFLVGGDRELTYFTDQDCSIHWGAGEACVPCSGEADCIEGPQDGALVKIKVNNAGVMPYVEWLFGSNYYVEIVTPIGDWAKDSCVNTGDIPSFADHYGMVCGDPNWDPIYDLVWDCIINTGDIPIFADHYGEGC